MDGGHPVEWRFNLEEPHSGERHSFVNIQAVIDFLNAELGQSRTRSELDGA